MVGRFKAILDRILGMNRYALAFGLFVLWTATLAEVDIFRMLDTRMERNQVENRIEATQDAIRSLDEQLAEIRERPEAKERHAREHYYMHKSNEDVYVFQSEN